MGESILDIGSFNWSLVIDALWNRAFLTPEGVCQYVLRLDELNGSTEKKQLGIQFATSLSATQMTRYLFEGLIIMADEERLEFSPETPANESDLLGSALRYARNAIEQFKTTYFRQFAFNVFWEIPKETIDASSIQNRIEALFRTSYSIKFPQKFRWFQQSSNADSLCERVEQYSNLHPYGLEIFTIKDTQQKYSVSFSLHTRAPVNDNRVLELLDQCEEFRENSRKRILDILGDK